MHKPPMHEERSDHGISFVIPSARPDRFLRSILQELSSQAPKAPCPVELLVVLDTETPDPESLATSCAGYARAAALSVLATSGRAGPATARNLGAKRARYRHVCFLDDDVVPEADFVSHLARAVPKHEKEAVMCRVVHHPDLLRVREARLFRSTWLGLPDRLSTYEDGAALDWRQMLTCALMIGRDTFLRAGMLSEQFHQAHYEDLDFAVRLHDLGGTVRLAGHAIGKHYNFRTPIEYLSWSVRNGYWKWVFSVTHPSRASDVLWVTRHPIGRVHLMDMVLTDADRSALQETLAVLGSQETLPTAEQRTFDEALTRLALDAESRSFVRTSEEHSLAKKRSA